MREGRAISGHEEETWREGRMADECDVHRLHAEAINAVIGEPWFLGWHWCAYVENTSRGWGIKDPWNEPYRDFTEPVREFNKSVYERV